MEENQKNKSVSDLWEKRWAGAGRGRTISFIGKRMFKAKAEVLRDVLKDIPVETAIEVGCGLGYTLEVIQQAGIDVIGIDVSSQAVSHCRKKGLAVSHKDLEQVEDRYDLVSSDGLLEHFLNFEPSAERLMRISKKYVLLIQPNHDSLSGKAVAFFAEILRGRTNVYEYNYRILDFVDVFERHDFRLIKNRAIFFNVFRLLLFKQGRPS